LELRHHVDIVLLISARTATRGEIEHATVAGSTFHWSCTQRKRRDRFLSDSDWPRRGSWDSGRGIAQLCVYNFFCEPSVSFVETNYFLVTDGRIYGHTLGTAEIARRVAARAISGKCGQLQASKAIMSCVARESPTPLQACMRSEGRARGNRQRARRRPHWAKASAEMTISRWAFPRSVKRPRYANLRPRMSAFETADIL
jgi:hypothetical protein